MGFASIMQSGASKKFSPLSELLCVMLSISQTHTRGQRRESSMPLSMGSSFYLSLFLKGVFRTTKFMSDQLQAPNYHPVAANDLVQSVIIALLEKRTEDKWKEIQQQAESVLKHRNGDTDSAICQKTGPESSTSGGLCCISPDRWNRHKKH